MTSLTHVTITIILCYFSSTVATDRRRSNNTLFPIAIYCLIWTLLSMYPTAIERFIWNRSPATGWRNVET